METLAHSLNPKSRKGTYRLSRPVVEHHPEAVLSFMRDCLVPLLADEFLRRRESAALSAGTLEPDKPTFEPLGKEGGL